MKRLVAYALNLWLHLQTLFTLWFIHVVWFTLILTGMTFVFHVSWIVFSYLDKFILIPSLPLSQMLCGQSLTGVFVAAMYRTKVMDMAGGLSIESDILCALDDVWNA